MLDNTSYFDDIHVRLRWAFLGDEMDALRKQFFSSQTLAHYTTAENAVRILKGEVWLRNTRVMNDVAEIEHGVSMVKRALAATSSDVADPILKQIGGLLDKAHPGVSQQVVDDFHSKLWNFVNRTYVTCLSVHDHERDHNGRLSMWRAYTGNYAGVALILNPEPFTQLVEDPSFFSVPVSYHTEIELIEAMKRAASALESDLHFISQQPRDIVAWYFASMLRKVATASKHHGFMEEQEWRVMHTRGVDPDDGLEFGVESVRGIPQNVAKISLRPNGPYSTQGLTIPNLLERVIIGPTNFPYVVADALQSAMEAAEIPNAASKIHISCIPLRMEY